MTGKYNDQDKLAELEREIGMRRAVYGRRIKRHEMTQVQADRQIGIMEEIAAEYRRKVQLRLAI